MSLVVTFRSLSPKSAARLLRASKFLGLSAQVEGPKDEYQEYATHLLEMASLDKTHTARRRQNQSKQNNKGAQ